SRFLVLRDGPGRMFLLLSHRGRIIGSRCVVGYGISVCLSLRIESRTMQALCNAQNLFSVR
ncbi:MAG: hypothetical protein ACLGJA_25875, partial [Gammaproteobacteria bacterium]